MPAVNCSSRTNGHIQTSVCCHTRNFFQYTNLVEPLSLDEAYLDVTEVENCQNSATLIAQEIRQKIFASQSITASAGIATNKFLAKVASDWHKPNGQKVITPDKVAEFITALPVTNLSGVGRVTAKKMYSLCLKNRADLQQLTRLELQQNLGKFGDSLYDYCRGIDNRPVITERVRKPLSIEDTFVKDLPDLEFCVRELPKLFEGLLTRLEKVQHQQELEIKNLFVKIKFNDFSIRTQQLTGEDISLINYKNLLEQLWQKEKRSVRLIGLGVQFKKLEQTNQLEFIDF